MDTIFMLLRASLCPAAKVKCTNVLFISHMRLKEVAFILYMKKNIDNSDIKLTLNIFVDLRTTCCDLSVV